MIQSGKKKEKDKPEYIMQKKKEYGRSYLRLFEGTT
jgi:hypothetical protein